MCNLKDDNKYLTLNTIISTTNVLMVIGDIIQNILKNNVLCITRLDLVEDLTQFF